MPYSAEKKDNIKLRTGVMAGVSRFNSLIWGLLQRFNCIVPCHLILHPSWNDLSVKKILELVLCFVRNIIF